MVIVEDSRNQIGKHKNINAYLQSVGLRVIRSKLIVGDYVIANRQYTSIDTKKDMVEVSQNIFQDHARFRRECELAKDCGIHLVVLIEDNTVSNYEELLQWTNPQPNRSALTPNGERCYKVMKAMEYSYGVEFQFCKKKDTGKRILQILTEGQHEKT
jgi:ERCC4-type nuclease